jgi:hypothetical protein
MDHKGPRCPHNAPKLSCAPCPVLKLRAAARVAHHHLTRSSDQTAFAASGSRGASTCSESRCSRQHQDAGDTLRVSFIAQLGGSTAEDKIVVLAPYHGG